MFYIIETDKQLNRFFSYDLSRCFVDVIPSNDSFHSGIANPSLVYIKPFRSRSGFILCIDHSESFSLDINSVYALFNNKVGQIYTLDGKRLRYYLKRETGLFCLKTAKFLNLEDLPSERKFNTPCHNFFYQKYLDKPDINRIIPISKHYEKYENLYKSISIDDRIFKTRYYQFYNKLVLDTLFQIESTGITIDLNSFNTHHTVSHQGRFISNNKIFGEYHNFTQTGRPSNNFNGINFSALKKDKAREFIVPGNDILVEFDYSAYHVRILANLIGYDLQNEDIHAHLGKIYFGKDELTEEEYQASKKVTFKNLYTDSFIEQFGNYEFFQKVKQLKEKLWEDYNKAGYISSWISGKPITGITSKTQILPFILQNYETERNVLIMDEILKYLSDKKTKLIMYCYDSFLFDVSKNDDPEILDDLKNILEQDDYKCSCSYGKNYSSMKDFLL